MQRIDLTEENPALFLMIRKRLIEWYRLSRRDLPWRRTRDPYKILVSEIMAQQTRISVVIPYYEAFLQRFPDIPSLAAASEDDVLKAWEGLGYYSRARNLYKAARIVAERYGGVIPDDEKVIRLLPGVGDYTAGAVLSIAFGRRAAAVDGNVRRILSRIFHIGEDVAKPAVKKRLSALALALTPDDDPGTFTQAMMELGALICVPGIPQCEACPLAGLCAAREAECAASLPAKAAPVPQRPVTRAVALIFDGERLLMRRRSDRLLHGMWELPGRDGSSDPKSLLLEELDAIGVRPQSVGCIGTFSHTFTHLKWEITAFLCRVSDTTPPKDYLWVGPDNIVGLAIPAAMGGPLQWAAQHLWQLVEQD